MATKLLARQPDPDPGESHGDFMDRCVDEMLNEDDSLNESDAEEACQIAWEDRKAPGVKHKTHADTVNGMEFVLSDETPDRMGEIISSDGWVLTNFKKNPIALFNHNSNWPIGTWRNLRIENQSLHGQLEQAPMGTSDRIDEIRKLIDAGVLKAVSVGFRPIESEPLEEVAPQRYIKQELVETSLVSVPANPNALAVAKSLKISPATIDLVFAESGRRRTRSLRRGFTGEFAATSRHNEGRAMSLAQRITDLETAIVAKRDALTAHLAKMDDSNVSDADLETTSALNAEIAQLEKTHDALVASEKLLGKTTATEPGVSRSRALSTTLAPRPTDGIASGAPIVIRGGRKKELDPIDYLVRAGTVAYAAKAWGRTFEESRQKIATEYPDYGDDAIKVVTDLVLRAASAPAMTTVTGWAAELAQTVYTEMMPLLMPKAVFTRLAARGLALNFGRAGKISIPTRSRTPTIAGSFVGEGLPIPVRQGAFTSQLLTPKKMAVITTWTREMDEHSTPAIEGVLRDAIQVDTSVAIDSVLLDANPATVIRPAGLLNGVAALTATAGGGLNALVGDIKQLGAALVSSLYGNIRTPVWLMNPGEVLSIGLASAAGTGVFPFKEEIGRNSLLNIPVIDSSSVPSKTVILIDAADFVSVGGEGPRFEMSDQATLHMEDTTPAELVAAGSPGVVAAPQRSLFQTDSLALRMILPLNWVQRRPGTVAWVQNVTW
jgi:HK97 family phage prohead protease/HK97 family phage major capsid protein